MKIHFQYHFIYQRIINTFPSLLLIALFFSSTLEVFAQSDGLPRGSYQMPYTRYEASGSSIGGGAVMLAPTFDQKKTESEASDQTCASLSAQNSYVRWNLTQAGQGLVIRYSMPDAAGGGGQTGSLALYVGGSFVQNITLTSKYAWQYFSPNPGDGTKDPTNSPSAGWTARMRFDEVRVKLPSSVTAGTEVKLQKTSSDGITYLVDFIEMEPIPTAVTQPANSLSVTSYGAVANDQNDDMPAFINCLNDAKTQGKSIYIPSGRFLLGTQGGKWMVTADNLTIQGAGVWYTELYFSNPGPNSGGIETNGTNLHLKDFYMNTENTSRTSGYKGFVGYYGTNSTIERVWAEHFEVGTWIANFQGSSVTDGLLITGCRFRNNYADGVNFSKGTMNSICEQTHFRNNGDDAMASWSSFDGPACINNEFRYCTAENTWRAAGIGFFGGGGHRGHHLLIKDGVETGIRVNSDFSGPEFSTTLWMEIYETTVISCGTNANLWFNRYGAVDIFTRLYNLQNLRLRNVNINNSQKDAIMIYTVSPNYQIRNIELINVTIDGTGRDNNVNNYTSGTYDDYAGYGLLVLPNVTGAMSTQNLVIQNATTAAIENESPTTFTINGLAPQVPVVSNTSLPSGNVGTAYSTTITATNNPTSYGATGLPSGLTVNTSSGVINGTPTVSGTFNVTLSATNSAGTGTKQLSLAINPPAVQAPYGGTARNLPGTIQAEDFDTGGEGVAYHDLDATNTGGQYRASEGVDIEASSEGGYNAGWLRAGEWIEYTVNVTTAGTYTLQARVATGLAGRTFHVEMNGTNISGTINIPNTGGWQTWQTVTVTTTSLTTGQKVMRIVIDSDDFNLNYLSFASTGGGAPPVINNTSLSAATVGAAYSATVTATNSPTSYGASGLPAGLSINTSTGVISGTPTTAGTSTVTLSATNASGTGTKQLSLVVNPASSQSPFGGTPWAIPGTIQAENFDDGGEGVAYHDTDAQNTGGQGRTGVGVDMEVCSEGGLNVGWTATGEWLEYTVNVATAGNYNIDVRIASTLTGGTFHIEFNGVDKTGLMTTTNTGAWQTWATISKTNVSLAAGVQVMRLYLDNANYNINSITISTATTGDPAGVITCYRTPGTITVNGSLTESGWNVTRSFSKATVGSPNNTATFGVLWDNTNLYVGAKILDGNLFSDSSDPWEDDAVEIYIDANNNKSTTYDGNDNQIIKNYNKTTVFTKFAVSGLQHGWATVTGGYTVEMAIPWSALGVSAPAQGTTIGFDIGYDDDDNGSTRDHQAVWNGTINNYQNTSGFGSLILNSSNSGGSSSGRMNTSEQREEKSSISFEEVAIEYWPTEVDNVLSISSDGTFDAVMIVDLLGRVQTDQSIIGQRHISLNVGHLTHGMHVVKMKGREKAYTFRILKK